MAAKDILGMKFGRLVVVERVGSTAGGSARWLCKCDCGLLRVVTGTALRAGRNKSCGCSSPRFTADSASTHKMSRTRTYRIWNGMRNRCNSASGKTARLYHDRGIRVCDRWREFTAFLEDMGPAPSGMSIDRIDGTKGYEPGNCRWATPKQQANNMSSNRIVEFDGQSKTVAQWAAEIGVKQNTLVYRLRRGWAIERALSTDGTGKGESGKH